MILITGGTGLVGKSISGENYVHLSSKECDLTDYQQTYQLLEKMMPEKVIHLAADVGGLYKNLNSNLEMLENNLLINLNVIRACRKLGIKNVISCLSTCVFPNEISYPIKEDQLHLGPPHSSNEGYSYAKRMLEIHSRLANYSCVIPTNIYGPDDNFSLDDGHVIPALIHQCYLAKKEKRDFVVRGSGKPLRQFLFSKDIGYILENVEFEGNLIISPDEEVSIRKVAELIAEFMGFEGKIVFDERYADGQFKKTASNEKLKTILPNFQFTSFEDGLKETVNWFQESYPNIRR